MNFSIPKYIALTNSIKQMSFLILICLCTISTLSASDEAMLTIDRGPYLQNMTSTSVVIKWRTSSLTESKISYGPTITNLNNSVYDAALKKDHELTITGTANTLYYYQIENNNAVLAGPASDMYVKLAPQIGTSQKVKAWILGDSGTANSNARNVRNAYYNYIGNNHTDLILFLGDNAYNDGTDNQYQYAMFENMYEDKLKNTVSYSCLGNHDGYSAVSSTQQGPYYDIFTFPTAGEAGGIASGTEAYYSFDYANIHFISLESYETDRSINSPMYTWVQNDIQNTTQDWIVAFWHHPPYTKGSHDSDNVNDSDGSMQDMRENFLPVLESNGVDLVLSGHSHSYERSFFVNGHYGNSTTFNKNIHTKPIGGDGNGKKDGSTGAYSKEICTDGSVYITAGSSGKTSYGPLNHPVMNYSAQNLGSVILEVNGQQMDVKFLRENGNIDDYFSIYKELPGSVCDDQNPNTHLDAFDQNCNCVGTSNPNCNNGSDFNIGEFTIVSDYDPITLAESSGLTVNPSGDFFVVSDNDGDIMRINNTGETEFDLNLSSCRDHESISFIGSTSPTSQRFAVSEERSRTIKIYDINQITENITLAGTLCITNISGSCGGPNNGIEGIAYDSGSNVIYFAEEDDRVIYQFTLPTTISGDMVVNASAVVDITTISNISSCTFSGMDVLPSGNLLLLMTHGNCLGDSGLFPRQLIELDPCGNFVERFDLETISDNNFDTEELEGVAAINNHIYLVGENLVLYDLIRNLPTTITVHTPSLGQTFSPGDQYTIQWSSQNLSGNVKIELFKAGNLLETIAANTTNNNSISATIPLTAPEGNDYQIKVSSIDNSTIFDFGDQFSIEDPSSITVLKPNSGAEFVDGDGMIIEWLSNNVTGGVIIELYKANNFVKTITGQTNKPSSFSWILDEDKPGIDYRIKITSYTDPTVFDFGDYFIITDPLPTITVTSPLASSVHPLGGNINIEWTHTNVTGSIHIVLYKNNFPVVSLGTADVSDLMYIAYIPTVILVGTDYQIKLSSIDNPSVFDIGDFFSLQNIPIPFITVISPDFKNLFAVGDNMDVEWALSNVTGQLNIELYKNNIPVMSVGNVNSIDLNTTVITPTSISPGNDYQIKLTSIDNPAIFDIGNFFTIQTDPVPTITVTSPKANETYPLGGNINIEWTQTNVTGLINIELYKNNIPVINLGVATPTDLITTVGILAFLSPGTDYQVKLTSLDNYIIFGLSDYFSLQNLPIPNITVTSPGTNNIFALGDNMDIEWTKDNVAGQFHIELWKDNIPVMSFGSVNSSDLSATVIIPSGITPGNDYQIKLTSVDNSAVFDIGDFFTIQSDPVATITVTSPIANIVIPLVGNIDIEWTHINMTGMINIELYKDNSPLMNLGSAPAADLMTNVAIPLTLSPGHGYQIKLSSIDYPAVFDLSDYFRFEDNPMITITNPVGGEVFIEGETFYIEWTSQNLPGNVVIMLHKLSSSLDYILESDYQNYVNGNNSYSYRIPDVEEGEYEISIYCVNDNSIWATSQSFDILDASITITNPTASDVFNPGQNITVQWTSVGISTVNLYLYKNGSPVSIFTTGIPNSGIETVTLPTSLTNGNDYHIYITSYIPFISDFSEQFTITN